MQSFIVTVNIPNHDDIRLKVNKETTTMRFLSSLYHRLTDYFHPSEFQIASETGVMLYPTNDLGEILGTENTKFFVYLITN